MNKVMMGAFIFILAAACMVIGIAIGASSAPTLYCSIHYSNGQAYADGCINGS
jgi:hypothetical protein